MSSMISLVILMFLNIYCSNTAQQIFCKNKESVMLEKCRTASLEFSELDVLNAENVRSVLEKNDSLLTTRTIVTDASGNAIFDTESPMNDATDYHNFSEINSALSGMDVFYWKYNDGIMISKSAAPIVSYVGLTGCVYMMEY